ncbi:hypothetical protein [Pseudoduganella namucuonensis]|uniref:Tetratricopeptide repeat protein n=1 Tax=Pseudoduganella namucuonensis TaxID=1035707 RepID=A0A1I7M7R1_9BURK|nr:hypothetical protein [Pseudoduganella namucuonensis]SFV17927.1 hypothetical protein SAMN05216552_10815 [Pseudoduganella namucuonensis]
MKRQLNACVLAALTLLSTQPAGAQQADPVPSEQRVTVRGLKNASAWFKAESQHFVIYSDTSRDSVFQLLNNLERLDFLLRLYTAPYGKFQPRESKLTLYFHRRPGALAQFADTPPRDAVGLYSSCGAGVQGAGVLLAPIVALANAELAKAPANDTLSFLFEGYARHFLYRHTTVRAPFSFIEGFALYFATTRFSDNQLVVGATPVNIGRYLDVIADTRSSTSLSNTDVLDDNDGDARNAAGVAAIKLEFAARSWLLAHFMLSTDDKRTRLSRYLDLTAGGTPASAAFETAFGIKPADLDNVLSRYRRTSLNAVQLDVPSLPAARITYTDLPDSVSDYVMMNATLKACPSRATGEALLSNMTSRPGGTPQHPLARLALSRARIDWGNPQDAMADLGMLAGGDKGSGEASYLLGLAHLRLANQQQGPARAGSLEAARRHLADAMRADPASAEAAYAQLRAELDTGEAPGEAALTKADFAWKNGREVGEYARAAALMYAYTGDSAKARQAINVLANNRRDPDMVKWAKQWQALLLAGVDRSEVLAELRRTPASGTVFKEWSISHDSALREVNLAAGAETLQRMRANQEATDRDRFIGRSIRNPAERPKKDEVQFSR